MNATPNYELTLKPDIITVFIASVLIRLLRPVRLMVWFIVSAIFLLAYYYLITKSLIFTPVLSIATFIMVIFIIFPITTFAKIYLNKLYTQKIHIQFFPEYIYSKRDTIEVKLKYSEIIKTKLIGDYLFTFNKTDKRIGYIFLKDYTKKEDLISFLKNKVNETNNS